MSNLSQEACAIIAHYKYAIKKIESRFAEIPYSNLIITKYLISLADSQTGIVTGASYNELARLLTVNPAPGRKESGTPTKQTIRNYIKSIERDCGEYFKVISEGQTLKFFFPELPKIFSKLFEKTEVDTGVNFTNTQMDIDVKPVFNDQVNIEPNTEVNTPNSAVKKLFININNNTNNNNLGEEIGSKNFKQPISPNFYPNPKTIARAFASGYSFATDANIIQEFIDKNTAWGSAFADFNPIYLSFLAKHAERKEQESVTSNTQTRSKNNERASPKVNSYDAALETVAKLHQNACKPSTEELFPTAKVISAEFEYRSCVMALDGTHQNIRHFVSN